MRKNLSIAIARNPRPDDVSTIGAAKDGIQFRNESVIPNSCDIKKINEPTKQRLDTERQVSVPEINSIPLLLKFSTPRTI
jgi:hypothetical protein